MHAIICVDQRLICFLATSFSFSFLSIALPKCIIQPIQLVYSLEHCGTGKKIFIGIKNVLRFVVFELQNNQFNFIFVLEKAIIIDLSIRVFMTKNRRKRIRTYKYNTIFIIFAF